MNGVCTRLTVERSVREANSFPERVSHTGHFECVTALLAAKGIDVNKRNRLFEPGQEPVHHTLQQQFLI